MEGSQVKKIKVGIIGCGVIARQTHGPRDKELGGRVEIVAACDIVKEKLDSYCDMFDIPKRYPAIAQMLADDEIDAVDVCLHNPAGTPTAKSLWRVRMPTL
jgi:predicted dehydrogenase